MCVQQAVAKLTQTSVLDALRMAFGVWKDVVVAVMAARSVVEAAQGAYDALRPDRYLVVLRGGGHAGPYEDAEDAFEPKVAGQDELVHGATIAFWDHYLLGIPSAGAELRRHPPTLHHPAKACRWSSCWSQNRRRFRVRRKAMVAVDL